MSTSVHAGIPPPPRKHTSREVHPPGKHTPWEVHPLGSTPPGKHTPWEAHPLGSTSPGKHTPWEVHPLGSTSPGSTSPGSTPRPRKHTPLGDSCRYGRYASYWNAFLVKFSFKDTCCEMDHTLENSWISGGSSGTRLASAPSGLAHPPRPAGNLGSDTDKYNLQRIPVGCVPPAAVAVRVSPRHPHRDQTPPRTRHPPSGSDTPWDQAPPPMNRITDTCKTLPSRNFVYGR